MAHNIKGTIDQDVGSSTRPLSMQRRKYQLACRRPFAACSTAPCVWLLAVQAAAPCSALATLRVFCPHPSTCAASVWGRRTITHVRVHAVAPGAARRCSYLLQKLPCGCAENPCRPPPFIPAAIYLHLSSHTTQ